MTMNQSNSHANQLVSLQHSTFQTGRKLWIYPMKGWDGRGKGFFKISLPFKQPL
jgi:hypothetical protein